MNFSEFLEEKRKTKRWKDPLNRHSMKTTRGANRPRQTMIPKVHQSGPGGVEIGVLKGKRAILPMTQKVLDIAKTSQQGIWKVSWHQALELADKYHINIPNRYDRSKKLGKTTILLWRRAPGMFYLVKNRKLKRMPTHYKGISRWDKPYH